MTDQEVAHAGRDRNHAEPCVGLDLDLALDVIPGPAHVDQRRTDVEFHVRPSECAEFPPAQPAVDRCRPERAFVSRKGDYQGRRLAPIGNSLAKRNRVSRRGGHQKDRAQRPIDENGLAHVAFSREPLTRGGAGPGVVSPVYSPVPASSWVGEVDPLVVALPLGQARTASRVAGLDPWARAEGVGRERDGAHARREPLSRASWRASGMNRARPRTRRSRPGGRGRRVRGRRFAAAACGAACRRRD